MKTPDPLGIARLGGDLVRQVCTTRRDLPHPKFKDELHRDWVKIEPGASYALPEMRGPGCVTCLWATLISGNFESTAGVLRALSRAFVYRRLRSLRETWLRVFYDGEGEPRVSAPLGDFFGVGFGEYRPFDSAFVGMTSGGYYSYFPMPFARSCRIEVENRGSREPVTFYGAATYAELGRLDDDAGYLHARFRHEPETKPGVPYEILDARGRGKYVGCVMNMQGKRKRDHFLFLEGNLKVFADGEAEPSLEYTGTEDYFMGGWYFNKGTFSAPCHGLTLKSWRKFRISAYRFHPDEGIPFQKSVRVLLHHGEFDEVPADYSSVAYWYQERAR